MTSEKTTPLRIIDANLNRAREALRVMEEFARLGLDDLLLSKAIKEVRHDLAHIVRSTQAFDNTTEPDAAASPQALDPQGDALIRSREIVGDVGCGVSTESESQRASATDVVLASCKRLSEALRSIEEYGKIVDPQFAAGVEKLRYRGYELERWLVITMTARARFRDVRLYAIITEAHCRTDWFETAEALLAGGADCLQLREKNLPDVEWLKRAKKLVALCHDRNAMCIINDRPDIAVASGADGVHLGQDDMPVSAARRILGPSGLIGVSTHTIEQVKSAVPLCPDYIAVGPMFQTRTKPQDFIAGTKILQQARAMTGLPIVAIGGITETNAVQVLQASACILCVCAGLVSQSDVAQVTAQLRALIVDAV